MFLSGSSSADGGHCDLTEQHTIYVCYINCFALNQPGMLMNIFWVGCSINYKTGWSVGTVYDCRNKMLGKDLQFSIKL